MLNLLENRRVPADPAATPRVSGRRRAVVTLLLFVTYVIVGKLSLGFALVHESASAVWPPTGIAIAAILLLGYRVWPALAAGAFLVNLLTKGSVAACLAIAAGNALEGMAGAWLVRRFLRGRSIFDSPQHVMVFVIAAGIAAPTVSATIGVTTLVLDGSARWADFGTVWRTWWFGDLGGALVVAPVLLLWAETPRVRWRWRTTLEALAAYALLMAVAGGVFCGASFGLWQHPYTFLVLPPLLWVARFGPRAASSGTLLLCALATWGTVKGTGPFSSLSANDSLIYLQMFIALISVTVLVLSVSLEAHRRARAELRSMNDHLEELVRDRTAELEAFTYSVAHDLRSPLRAMRGFADLVLEEAGVKLEPRQLDYLHRIARESGRMDALVRDLLSYSRLSRMELPLHAVDLEAVLRSVLSGFEKDIQECRARVTVNGEFPRVTGHKATLTQAIVNLISNALKFVDPGVVPELRISALSESDRLRMIVEDNGIGIAAEHQERIFRVFERLNASEAYAGTGIGLAIVKRAIERMGGTVGVESSPGRGSRFWIELPQAREVPADAVGTIPPRPATAREESGAAPA